MSRKVLTHILSEPLGSMRAAKFDIHAGDGNLMIDRLTSGEPMLASGTLQYLENQQRPNCSMIMNHDMATFTLRSGGRGQPWLHLPWSTCNGATEWQIHLNPGVPSEVSACTNGGNVKLDFTGMAITRVWANTGGGNMDVVLPDHAAKIDVNAKTGAGNVTIAIGEGMTGRSTIDTGSGAGNVVIRLPAGVAARLCLGTGLGKVIVDPRFSKIDNKTYVSPDYDNAADQIEITAKSGAGNVVIETK